MAGKLQRNTRLIRIVLFGFMVLMLSCTKTWIANPPPRTTPFLAVQETLNPLGLPTQVHLNTMVPLNLPTRIPGVPVQTPTPDHPRVLPTIRSETIFHVVQPGETLGLITRKYNANLNRIVEANQLPDPNLLSIGQTLVIPPPVLTAKGTGFKIIPDSELIYGPAGILTNAQVFTQQTGGYLKKYKEEVFDETLTGAEIISQVARDYSVNPRLLLALLEHQSGWVTRSNPPENTLDYPLGNVDPDRKGLYRQLSWAANNLNRGYYLWKVNAIAYWMLSDGNVVPVDETINAGTAGVQYLLSLLFDRSAWDLAVSPQGLASTYERLFGFPFDWALEPALPSNLQQPPLQLPFEKGTTWSFTGGPHGSWGDGSAWAALDFAPPGNALGCVTSDEWVTAVSDGLIVRSERGVVVLDLDGDGYEGTGWTILYLHIETRDRVPLWSWVSTGDRIGHPSCEGGLSSGTHVHIARRYNGEWIPADGKNPFNLEDWISEGIGIEYDGYLIKNGQLVEAWDSRKAENQISR